MIWGHDFLAWGFVANMARVEESRFNTRSKGGNVTTGVPASTSSSQSVLVEEVN